MAEATIQLQPESTGPYARTQTNTQGAHTVHQQVTTPAAATGEVANPVSPTLYDGQNASVTTTPGALASSQAVSELLLQADPSNTDTILVGSSSSQHLVLAPGASTTIPASNLNVVYVKSASGTQKANYLGRA